MVFEDDMSSPGSDPGTAGAFEASSRYDVSSSKNISSPSASNSVHRNMNMIYIIMMLREDEKLRFIFILLC